MKTQQKQKKEKNEIKVRDLKPAKDPKGGFLRVHAVPVAAGITPRHRGKASESKSCTVVRCRCGSFMYTFGRLAQI